MRPRVRTVLIFLLTLGLLAFFLRNADMSAVWAETRRARPSMLIAATFLLPARAGEVIRPYLLARREGLPATAAFATIILERLLDLVTVLGLFAVFVLTLNPASLSADAAQFARVKVGG